MCQGFSWVLALLAAMPAAAAISPSTITDTLLAVGNSTSATMGTLAFAITHLSMFQTGTIPADGNAFSNVLANIASAGSRPNVKLAYSRRKRTYAEGYDPNLNLTSVNLPVPVAAACGDNVVQCVPGPCSVWEYDYQFEGAQAATSNRGYRDSMITTLPLDQFSGAYNYYSMIGTPRCGPLYNTQYVKVTKKGGENGFDSKEVVTPEAIPHESFFFLPTVLGTPVDVYPIPNERMAPVPDGINLNPNWYYTGWPECYDKNNVELTGLAASQCDMPKLFMSHMYNAFPRRETAAHRVCDGKQPPPFAAAIQPDHTKLGVPLDLSNAASERNEPVTPDLFDGSNPRMAMAYPATATGDLDLDEAGGIRVLVGYVRGVEDGYIEGDSNISTYAMHNSDGSTHNPVKYGFPNKYSNDDAGGGTTRLTHFPFSGLGPNHDILPQERTPAWREEMCDPSQCRWVPGLWDDPHGVCKTPPCIENPKFVEAFDPALVLYEEHGLKAHEEGNPDWPWASMTAYVAAASELRETPDPPPGTNNRYRCYGKRTMNPPTVIMDPNYAKLNPKYSRSNQYASLCRPKVWTNDSDCQIVNVNVTGSVDSTSTVTIELPDTTCCGIYDPTQSQEGFYEKACLKTISGDVGGLYGNRKDGAFHHLQKDNSYIMECDSFYQRQEGAEVLFKGNSRLFGSHDNGCKFTDFAAYEDDGSPIPPPHKLSECDNLSGAAVRLRDVKWYNRLYRDGVLAHNMLQWSRAASYGMATWKTTLSDGQYSAEYNPTRLMQPHWHPPGFAPMACVTDDQARLIYLQDTYGRKGKLGMAGNFDYEAADMKRSLDPNSDKPDLAVLMALPKSANRYKPASSGSYSYRPLEAYYQESRSAYPNPTTDRLGAFANSNQITNSFACDCNAIAIRWEYLQVPTDSANSVPANLLALLKQYKSSRLLISSYSWETQRVSSSPIIGLYLPSSQAVTLIAERDLLKAVVPVKLKAVDPTLVAPVNVSTDPVYDDGIRTIVQAHLDDPVTPTIDTLPNMTFDGSRLVGVHGVPKAKADALANDPYFVSMSVFKQGSCMRWPYGQVPRMAFADAQAVPYWPAHTSGANAEAHEFGPEAMMGYCETVRNTKLYQYCDKDKFTSSERRQFCTDEKVAANNIMWAIGLDARSLDSVCSTEHKTCLVIPGDGVFGSVANVLKHLHTDAANYEILVTPFNYSIVEPYMAPGRQLQLVGHGVPFGPTPGFSYQTTRLGDKSRAFSGIQTDQDVYTMLDDNTCSADRIRKLVLVLAQQLLVTQDSDAATWAAAGCVQPAGTGAEKVYATSSLGNAKNRLRCLKHSEVFYPNSEHGIRVDEPNVTIRSALPTFNGEATPLSFGHKKALQKARSSQPCTQMYITADNAVVGPMVSDQSNCNHLDKFHATPILLSGPSVTGLRVEALTVLGGVAGVGVLFAGDDAALSRVHKDVNVANTSVVLTSELGLEYSAGYARAYGGQVNVTCGNITCHVMIMPVSADTLNFTAQPDTLVVTNLSDYTNALGDGYMHWVYHTRLYPDIVLIPILAVLAVAAVVGVILIVRAVRKQQHQLKLKYE